MCSPHLFLVCHPNTMESEIWELYNHRILLQRFQNILLFFCSFHKFAGENVFVDSVLIRGLLVCCVLLSDRNFPSG